MYTNDSIPMSTVTAQVYWGTNYYAATPECGMVEIINWSIARADIFGALIFIL